MLDVVCYAKYSTFSSNQTGNTVMLATASLHLRTSPRKCILATTSLVSWLTGAFLFGQVRRNRELVWAVLQGRMRGGARASGCKVCGARRRTAAASRSFTLSTTALAPLRQGMSLFSLLHLSG
jgi:hypothetical protein